MKNKTKVSNTLNFYMKDILNRLTAFTKLFTVPFILMFSIGAGVTYYDRLRYFLYSIWISFPFIAIYKHFVGWYGHHEVFFDAACIIIAINAFFGGVSHWKQGTFSWLKLFLKNIAIVAITFCGYIVLEKLFGFFQDTFIGNTLKSAISFMVLMYPASKFMTSSFIITNGKFPPIFLMKLFYNYEKTGRLKEFFNLIQGEGITQEIVEEELKKSEENLEEEVK